jgi:hypothetical protein
MDTCEICDYAISVHSDSELEVCRKVRLLDNLIKEIEGGEVEFTISTSIDNEKLVYVTSIIRHDKDVSFFGEGPTPLEAIEDVLK